jgi:CheY-like chemotaxis protein
MNATRIAESNVTVAGDDAARPWAILVVDDDCAVRTLTARILRGHTIVEAGSGERAMAILVSAAGGFDVAIVDVVMPGVVRGAHIGRAIRRLHPSCGLVFMTGYSRDVLKGDLPECDAWLEKPYSPAELLAAVAQASARQQRQSASGSDAGQAG